MTVRHIFIALGVVEFLLRKSKLPHGQYVPYAIGNKNLRNKNSTIIEFDASAVCVSVFINFGWGTTVRSPSRPKYYDLKNSVLLRLSESVFTRSDVCLTSESTTRYTWRWYKNDATGTRMMWGNQMKWYDQSFINLILDGDWTMSTVSPMIDVICDGFSKRLEVKNC